MLRSFTVVAPWLIVSLIAVFVVHRQIQSQPSLTFKIGGIRISFEVDENTTETPSISTQPTPLPQPLPTLLPHPTPTPLPRPSTLPNNNVDVDVVSPKKDERASSGDLDSESIKAESYKDGIYQAISVNAEGSIGTDLSTRGISSPNDGTFDVYAFYARSAGIDMAEYRKRYGDYHAPSPTPGGGPQPFADLCYFWDSEKYDPYSPACLRDNMPTVPSHLLPEHLQQHQKKKEVSRDTTNNRDEEKRFASSASSDPTDSKTGYVEKQTPIPLHRWEGATKYLHKPGNSGEGPREATLCEEKKPPENGRKMRPMLKRANPEKRNQDIRRKESTLFHTSWKESDYVPPGAVEQTQHHASTERGVEKVATTTTTTTTTSAPSWLPNASPVATPLNRTSTGHGRRLKSKPGDEGDDSVSTPNTARPITASPGGINSENLDVVNPTDTSLIVSLNLEKDELLPMNSSDSTVHSTTPLGIVAGSVNEMHQSASSQPTVSATLQTQSPTMGPTNAPSKKTSAQVPSASLMSSVTVKRPTTQLTTDPTRSSTETFSAHPTDVPTIAPTMVPTKFPIENSSMRTPAVPTEAPTLGPTNLPTEKPSTRQPAVPTIAPTLGPTNLPTEKPSTRQPAVPTIAPTLSPTNLPTEKPSTRQPAVPTIAPTLGPTNLPTESTSTGAPAVPTMAPTSGPTNLPTEKPSAVSPIAVPSSSPEWGPKNLPTEKPSVSPSSSSMQPSASPTFNQCPISTCDFAKLEVGVPISDVHQSDILDSLCSFAVSGNKRDGTGVLGVNVFNSSNPTSGQWNLGSPHASCGGNEWVNGGGGDIDGPYPNCVSQGNVLVLQEEGVSSEVPDSAEKGGCLVVDFVDPVRIANIGILNVKKGESVVLYLENGDGAQEYISSLIDMSENSLWLVNMTHPSVKMETLKIEVCFPSEGAISFISWYDDCAPTPGPTGFPTISPKPSTPTSTPTNGPTSSPTNGPTFLPTEEPTNSQFQRHLKKDQPSDPTAAPTERDRRFLEGARKYIPCDFSALEPGVLLSDVGQSDLIESLCGVTISAANGDGIGARQVRVYDTANVTNDKWALGSPHVSCGGDQKVTGIGGLADGPYPNCDPQGNVLILAEETNEANSQGGCMNFDFVDPVMLVGMGLLNVIGESPVRITIMTDEGEATDITSPEDAGMNSLWQVNKTHPSLKQKGVILVTVCFASSTAVSFIDFFAERTSEISEEVLTEPIAPHKDDQNFPWCGSHLSGFALARHSVNNDTVDVLPGYELLSDGQSIPISDLPQDFVISPIVDDHVGAIRYYLPSSEIMAFHNFNLESEWLRHETGTVSIRADAFSVKDETFLGSCAISVRLDQSQHLKCGPGVTGFFFVDRSGTKLDKIGNLRNGQVVPQGRLPAGADLAVSYEASRVGAIRYLGPGTREAYETHEPFRLNLNNFDLPGYYTVKAHGYSDKDFSAFLDSCEISFEVSENEESRKSDTSRFAISDNVYPMKKTEDGTAADSIAIPSLFAGYNKEDESDLSLEDETVVDDDFLPSEATEDQFESISINRERQLLKENNTVEETASPEVPATEAPTEAPATKAPQAPTLLPTLSPTELDRRFLEGSVKRLHCDFSNLEAGILVSDVQQSDILESSCHLTISGAREDSRGTRQVRVFDTTNVTGENQNLGSPHSSCGGQTIVNGTGGAAHGPFPNCKSQGNVIILEPGNQSLEGCINVDFVNPVQLNDMGLLDVPADRPLKISVMNDEGEISVITSPDNAGPNSLWSVRETNPEIQTKGVVLVTVCFSTPSGAISFLDYTMDLVETLDGTKETAATTLFPDTSNAKSAELEESFPWCGRHISGFSFVAPRNMEQGGDENGDVSMTFLPGFELLSEGQDIRIFELPQNFDLVSVADEKVGAIRYYFSSDGESFSQTRPFRISARDWLKSFQAFQQGGTEMLVEIRADAFQVGSEDQIEETFLGSCSVSVKVVAGSGFKFPVDGEPKQAALESKIDMDSKETQLRPNHFPLKSDDNVEQCGPGVTGFFLTDRHGNEISEFSLAVNSQVVIKGNKLPYGTDLAIRYDETMVGAVKFEGSWLEEDVFSSRPPFSINSKRFHRPGSYLVKVYGYKDEEFSSLVNSCEIKIDIIR